MTPVIFSFLESTVWLGKLSANVRLKTAERTDKRVESMYSIINGIQVIKMYGWEEAFERAIKDVRNREIKAIAQSFYIKATLFSFEILTSIAVFTTLVVYVYTGNDITAQKAFVTIAYFSYVNRTLVNFWPMAITSVAEGWISIRRVEEFLLHKTKESSRGEETGKVAAEPRIAMKSLSAKWNQNDTFELSNIDLTIARRSLTAVVGQVGCGKTTLLEVLLKEIPITSGSLEVHGSLSYAAQQAWIFEGTVRSNIVFTEDYDAERYKKVISVCALEHDLSLFPKADQTMIGDRGISLSGGQKARINLARAVYKKADIYLLDDPLSAVDAHVGKHIFKNCIESFLSEKICVLVTHQIQFLKEVKHVVEMKGGKVKDVENLEDLVERSKSEEAAEGDEVSLNDFLDEKFRRLKILLRNQV